MYLRPYQSSDLESAFRLDQACFAPQFRFSRAMMRQVTEGTGALVRLACEMDTESGEHLLGFAAADLQALSGEMVGYIATLDVAHEARRRGIGRSLVVELERLVMAAGGRWMFLHVFTGNTAALRLYEGLQYMRARQIRAFYGAGYDAWLCRKRLHGVAT